MDKRKFGQFIKEARLTKNLTQAELAEQLFVDVTAVSKWERGVNFPDISVISDICKCLDITEHELIESSQDTEYRQMMYNSKQYLKSKKIAFWSVTGCFITAIVTCFIVNLCVSHTLSWFFIVLSGCACGYWAFLYPVLLGKVKKSVEESVGRVLSKLALLIYAAGLLGLTLAILLTTHAYAPFDVTFGINVTLYCFLILFAYGIVELFSVHRLTKLGIDSLLTGVFTVSLAKVLPALMRVEEEDYFHIDFRDWAGHSNGNVACIVLTCFAMAGVILIILGIQSQKRKE